MSVKRCLGCFGIGRLADLAQSTSQPNSCLLLLVLGRNFPSITGLLQFKDRRARGQSAPHRSGWGRPLKGELAASLLLKRGLLRHVAIWHPFATPGGSFLALGHAAGFTNNAPRCVERVPGFRERLRKIPPPFAATSIQSAMRARARIQRCHSHMCHPNVSCTSHTMVSYAHLASPAPSDLQIFRGVILRGQAWGCRALDSTEFFAAGTPHRTYTCYRNATKKTRGFNATAPCALFAPGKWPPCN